MPAQSITVSFALVSLVIGLLTTLPLAATARAADPAYGEYLSSECVTCHRRDGQDKGIPPIIGWPADQFVAVLRSYKTKDRENAVMQTIAGRLTDDDMAAVAAFYGSLKPAQ